MLSIGMAIWSEEVTDVARAQKVSDGTNIKLFARTQLSQIFDSIKPTHEPRSRSETRLISSDIRSDPISSPRTRGGFRKSRIGTRSKPNTDALKRPPSTFAVDAVETRRELVPMGSLRTAAGVESGVRVTRGATPRRLTVPYLRLFNGIPAIVMRQLNNSTIGRHLLLDLFEFCVVIAS
ncbi:hypothetical protein EVAR_96266_1 [Eumeta japonica]|uniref:Uncharacterized protein n=1 Tax=Eumeta variegata TaxID=151549 RepID=A0A4C1WNL6_EUMVA|nr:hypothetical protein EVAR_96266_1 [Eumeta japonica]